MPGEAQAAANTAKTAISTAKDALDLYNKVLDQLIPWGTFEETIKELTRYQDEYSKESSKLVGEVKTLLMTSQDKYFESTQSIYEWCGVSVQLLKAYLTLFEKFDERKAEAQKAILLKVLGDGIKKMEDSQKALAGSSTSFNEAAGKLLSLNSQLASDFSEKSDYYNNQVDKLRKQAYGGAAAGVVGGPFGLIISYSIAAGVLEGKLIPELKNKLASVKSFFESLQEKVTTASGDIDKTKAELKAEISVIGDMKTQTEATKLYVEYDDMMLTFLKEAAGELIIQCNDYQKRHGKKNAA